MTLLEEYKQKRRVGYNTVTDSDEPCIDVHLKEKNEVRDVEGD